MNILIFLAIICLHTVQHINGGCEEARQLESTCSTYCFQAMRPILEHSKTLQQKLDSQDVAQIEKSELCDKGSLLVGFNALEEKLQQFEDLWTEKFDNIESKLLEKQISVGQQQTQDNSDVQISNIGAYTKIGSKYYAIESEKSVSWFEAEYKCQLLGGHLASPENAVEFQALYVHLKRKSYWLGINDLRLENEFVSAITGQRARYLRWARNEPNNGGNRENCVEIMFRNLGYEMNDNKCNINRSYICELSAKNE